MNSSQHTRNIFLNQILMSNCQHHMTRKYYLFLKTSQAYTQAASKLESRFF